MREIRPNRLSTPGEREAHARIEAVFAAVDRLSAEELNNATAPRADAVDRDSRRVLVEQIADTAGFGAMLDRARDSLTDALLRRFADRIAYPYGTRAVGSARVEDQAAVITALRDLVAVAAVRDLVSDDDAAALAAPGLVILGAESLDEVLDLAVGDPALDGGDDPGRGAPTAADWAAAASGETAIRQPGSDRGRRDPRALVLLVLVAGSVLAIVAVRMDRSQVAVGALLAGAAILVVWAVLALRRR